MLEHTIIKHFKMQIGSTGVLLRVKALATKSDNLSLSLRTHAV